MKSKLNLSRVLAFLLILAFFALVFSAITLGTHDCQHNEFCAVCAYKSEHRNELFIPVLLACTLIISLISLYLLLRVCVGSLAFFTPVKLKVKLSD